MTDIVIDTNVMRLFDAPADPRYIDLFQWLTSEGKLAVSNALIHEYNGTQNRLIFTLISELQKKSRLVRISSRDINAFSQDKHYKYTCNFKDQSHARLTFLSERKLLVGGDAKLVNDINGFPKVNKVKPKAAAHPPAQFYR